MDATATRMTAEQYYAITVEGDRKQLVDGAIVVNEPKLTHGERIANLIFVLRLWISGGEGRGKVFPATDVVLDEHNVYGPDVIWIAEEHLPTDLDRYPERVPDICVEVRSPSTWRYDIGTKRTVYERSGLPELWLVDDAAETVLVYRRSTPGSPSFDVALELGHGETLSSPQLPGFALEPDELFLA